MEDYFRYRFSNDIEFSIKEKQFVSIIGNTNDLILHTLVNTHPKCNIFIGENELTKDNLLTVRKNISFVLYKHLDTFVGETVRDEIAFGLESLAWTKDDITSTIISYARVFKLEELLERDPNSLGSSDKVKMKIMSSIVVKPKIIVLDNVTDELDTNDKKIVFKALNEFKKFGGIVINFTNNIEDTLEGTDIIVIQDKKVICSGKTLSVLNEEKLLKRLGLGLPFIIELNRYLMDYGMINKYYLDKEKLVKALWK